MENSFTFTNWKNLYPEYPQWFTDSRKSQLKWLGHSQRTTALHFIWTYKLSWRAKEILNNKNKGRGITIPDFTIYCRTTWYGPRNRHVDKWKRLGIAESDPHIYNQLIFHKWAKITLRKSQSVKQLMLGKLALSLHAEVWEDIPTSNHIKTSTHNGLSI